jgi:hypothetical protein
LIRTAVKTPIFRRAALLAAIVAVNALAGIEYRVTLDGVLDNFEYGRSYPIRFYDRTTFFVRAQPEVGFVVDDNHKIRGGFSYLQEFGGPALSEDLHLLLYYHYDDERLQFRFGSFPRAGALDVPEWLFGKSFAYYRPFVHGAAVETGSGDIVAGAWVDWTGRRTLYVNEAFLFGTKLAYSRGNFFARHDFLMYHYAHTLVPYRDTYVWDNGGMSAEVGATWGETAFFDTLAVSAGAIIGLDRDRGDNIWHTPAVGFVSAFAAARMLAVRGFISVGEPLRMAWGEDLWSRYMNVDGHYAFTETYARLDLITRFAMRENIRAELAIAFHYINRDINHQPANLAGFSQHFALHAEFGGSTKKEEEKKKGRRRRGFGIRFFWE